MRAFVVGEANPEKKDSNQCANRRQLFRTNWMESPNLKMAKEEDR
ncbi:hypothetical protein BRADI_1g69115v3 [Brachypodium distachyon]|uniref:Uncharacterized protein n=1 Tax=Brachypodium distachyon TaxID=15368 RepID=A0A2K2DU54_BRADI|nr:hypothetical protein BRADI_1g69115v3 [Brachypodium distachyon]